MKDPFAPLEVDLRDVPKEFMDTSPLGFDIARQVTADRARELGNVQREMSIEQAKAKLEAQKIISELYGGDALPSTGDVEKALGQSGQANLAYGFAQQRASKEARKAQTVERRQEVEFKEILRGVESGAIPPEVAESMAINTGLSNHPTYGPLLRADILRSTAQAQEKLRGLRYRTNPRPVELVGPDGKPAYFDLNDMAYVNELIREKGYDRPRKGGSEPAAAVAVGPQVGAPGTQGEIRIGPDGKKYRVVK